jgi:hypothetical protein
MTFPTVVVDDARKTVLGQCGNGVCEVGERCAHRKLDGGPDVPHECCARDCPIVIADCPRSGVERQSCNGAGVCVPNVQGVGVCRCFAGYNGDACDVCDKGMVRDGDTCVHVVATRPALPTPSPCPLAKFRSADPAPVSSISSAAIRNNRVSLDVMVRRARVDGVWMACGWCVRACVGLRVCACTCVCGCE